MSINHEPLADGETYVCPECGSSGITRAGAGSATRRQGATWNCSACYHHFESPDRRERKNGSHGPQNGLAKDLLDADPDEVSR